MSEVCSYARSGVTKRRGHRTLRKDLLALRVRHPARSKIVPVPVPVADDIAPGTANAGYPERCRGGP
jgi:hypothetical protein